MLLCCVLAVVVDDALVFYILFELLLLLMYCYLVGRMLTKRASYAVALLVAYTLIGSSVMAVDFVLLYLATGGASYTLSTG